MFIFVVMKKRPPQGSYFEDPSEAILTLCATRELAAAAIEAAIDETVAALYGPDTLIEGSGRAWLRADYEIYPMELQV